MRGGCQMQGPGTRKTVLGIETEVWCRLVGVTYKGLIRDTDLYDAGWDF